MPIIPHLTADMTPAELAERLGDIDQQRSECAAEAGMGAVSMGFDPYDAMSVYNARIEISDWEREARARVAEAYPPPVVVRSPVDPDDIPF